MTKPDLILAQHSFYSPARSVLKVLDFLLERGKEDEALKTIRQQARLIKAIQGLRPRARRH